MQYFFEVFAKATLFATISESLFCATKEASSYKSQRKSLMLIYNI